LATFYNAPLNEENQVPSRLCTEHDNATWISALKNHENLNSFEYVSRAQYGAQNDFDFTYILITPEGVTEGNRSASSVIKSVKIDNCEVCQCTKYSGSAPYWIGSDGSWECIVPYSISYSQMVKVATDRKTAYIMVTFASSKTQFLRFSFKDYYESTLEISAGTNYLKMTQQSKIFIPSTEMFQFYSRGNKKCLSQDETIWQPELSSNKDGSDKFIITIQPAREIILVSVRAAVPLDVIIGLVAAYLGFADIIVRIILYLSMLCQKFYSWQKNERDDEVSLISKSVEYPEF